jgi:hypothetical protein
MRQTIRRSLVLAGITMALVGCRADEVALDVDSTKLRSALAGNDVVAEFHAVFTHDRPLNTRQSAQVDDVWRVLDEYLMISDFSRDTVDGGLRVTIDGEIPIRTSRDARHAYYLSVTESQALDGLYRVNLQTGDRFAAMREALASVNFELDLAAIHPTVTTLTGRASQVLAPAAEAGGETHLIYGRRLDDSLQFRQAGGTFESTGPGFFIRFAE